MATDTFIPGKLYKSIYSFRLSDEHNERDIRYQGGECLMYLGFNEIPGKYGHVPAGVCMHFLYGEWKVVHWIGFDVLKKGFFSDFTTNKHITKIIFNGIER
jgi:hypothetical protein